MADTDVLNARNGDCCDATHTPAIPPPGVAPNTQAYLDWLKTCKETQAAEITSLQETKGIVSSLVDNGDGTFTHDNGNGDQVIIPINSDTMFTPYAHNSVQFDQNISGVSDNVWEYGNVLSQTLDFETDPVPYTNSTDRPQLVRIRADITAIDWQYLNSPNGFFSVLVLLRANGVIRDSQRLRHKHDNAGSGEVSSRHGDGYNLHWTEVVMPGESVATFIQVLIQSSTDAINTNTGTFQQSSIAGQTLKTHFYAIACDEIN